MRTLTTPIGTVWRIEGLADPSTGSIGFGTADGATTALMIDPHRFLIAVETQIGPGEPLRVSDGLAMRLTLPRGCDEVAVVAVLTEHASTLDDVEASFGGASWNGGWTVGEWNIDARDVAEASLERAFAEMVTQRIMGTSPPPQAGDT